MDFLSEVGRKRIEKILSHVQSWDIVRMTAEVIRDISSKGEDDGYNMAVGIREGERVSISYNGGVFAPEGLFYEGEHDSSPVLYTWRPLSVERGYIIDGGCGYGSRVQGWISSSLVELAFRSCGGHWVKLRLANDISKLHIQVKCDSIPSEMSWGDGEKSGWERASRIESSIEKAGLLKF